MSLRRPDRCFRLFHGVLILLTVGVCLPAAADLFTVSSTVDSVPAPPGTLRWAIEQSEANNTPDSIVFSIDGGQIDLVAPLPDLTAGGLSINERRLVSPGGNGITIGGANGIVRAIRVLSRDNLIAGLDFVRFSGPEVVLIDGSQAIDNEISGCVFGRDGGTGTNAGTAIRIGSPDNLGTPRGTLIEHSRFLDNGGGIWIDGDGVSAVDAEPTRILGNDFGTGPGGSPGPGTGTAIRAAGAGRVLIRGNRFSGPGTGIDLGPGSDDSVVVDNSIGAVSPDGLACSGFGGAAVRVEDSDRVVIEANLFRCNDEGIHLATNADEARVLGNRIGGAPPDGNRSHGILLDPGHGALLRGNRISGNDGYGVASIAGPVIDPAKGALLACNEVWGNLSGPLSFPAVTTSPPLLISASAVAVGGELPDPVAGWIELFGDDADQARVFQGALRVDDAGAPFSASIPVLDLMTAKTPDGVQISFDRTVPGFHTSTLSDETMHQTTELSLDLPADKTGLVYDVIRGELDNLAFAAGGGIDLGPVVCLGSGLTEDAALTPDPVDPQDPPVGKGFFYLSRRRDEMATVNGTYDPAICLTEIDGFGGPRRPRSGDCLP